MGLSTVIEINNDFLNEIEKDPKQWAEDVIEKIHNGDGVKSMECGRFHGIYHRDSKIYKDFRKLFEF